MQPYYSLSKTTFLTSSKKRDHSFFIIALVVIALHLLFVLFSYVTFTNPIQKSLRQNVVVKTVQLNPKLEPVSTATIEKIPSIQQQPLPPPPLPTEAAPSKVETTPVVKDPPKPIEKPAPKPAPPPLKKAEVKKPEVKPVPPKPKVEPQKPTQAKKPQTLAPVKKAETPPPKPKAPEIDAKALAAEKAKQQAIAAAEEAARQKQQQLLSKAKESLAKMGETKDKINLNSSISLSDTSIPQRIQSLQIDALPAMGGISLGSQEIRYQDELGARLKQALKLPDYGTVKVKLTLEKSGKVSQIEVTSTSDKNKKYIEKTLPTLSFSPFGSQFSGAEQYTFMLTLHNDE